MNKEQAKLFYDPITESKLQLHIIESKLINDVEQIKSGVFFDPNSKIMFPIINFVPIFLVFRTSLTEKFIKDYETELQQFEGYSLPDRPLLKGEKTVQKMFTEEWNQLRDADIVFAYDSDQVFELHKMWLQLKSPDLVTKSVLNVGCGFGKESQTLSKLHPNATVVGIDLNMSLLNSVEDFLKNPNTVYAISSLFNMPFKKESFEHVHCQGVLMHTHNTKIGFESISSFVTKRGSLFVWVYGREDDFEREGVIGFLMFLLSMFNRYVTRKILIHSPALLRNLLISVMARMTHWHFKKHLNQENWTLKNTIHCLRDSFTPPYMSRHGFNQLVRWFESKGYFPLVQQSGTIEKALERKLLGVGILGKRSDFFHNLMEISQKY